MSLRSTRPPLPRLLALLCSVALAAGLASTIATPIAAAQAQDKNNENGIVILSPSELPPTYPRASYAYPLRAHGRTSTPHWHLLNGSTLPPGLRLEGDGRISGVPQRAGEYHFTIVASDGDHNDDVQKDFILKVIEAITVNWKAQAHVNGNRIEGSVEVGNTTANDVDLTFIVEAVAQNGRATAIGYQHFPLPRATQAMELPFGESLPSGAYLVNVDVVGEVASINQIYRQRLQMPHRLNVTVGP